MSENEAERELDKALAEYADEEIQKLIAEGKKQTKHRYEKGVQY